jgi:hypothetical protein
MPELIRDITQHTKVFEEKVSSDDIMLTGDPCWLIQGIVTHNDNDSRRYTVTVKNYYEGETDDPELCIQVSSDRYGDLAEDVLESVKNMLETLDSTPMEIK